MRTTWRRSVLASILVLLAVSALADEGRLNREIDFTIPPQQLDAALLELGRQANLQLMFSAREFRAIATPGLHGRMPIGKALELLLRDTGLTYQMIGDATVTVKPVAQGPTATHEPSSHFASDAIRIAQVAPDAGARDAVANGDRERSDAGSPGKLEEIVVSAQKREERLQDVPISIAVITNQEIERRGFIGMEDYLRSVPGVNQIDNGPLSNSIVIRGLTTGPMFENSGSGPTVATYFDESPITATLGYGSGGGVDIRPVDVERIEILRGPQGTAYGSASLGGTVRIIPAKPKLGAFGAKLSASYADTSGFGSDNSTIQGVVNIPLVRDTFALRAVAYRFDQSGYYRNVAGMDPAAIAKARDFGLGDYTTGFVQNDVGRMRSTGGRLAAHWKPTENLDISATFLTQKIEQDGSPYATNGGYEQSNLPVSPQGRERNELGDVNDSDLDLFSVVLNYDLGWGLLTSTASWANSGSVWASDISRFYPHALSSTGPSNVRAVSAETRIATRLDGRIQFLGGLYYENIDDDFVQHTDWAGTPANNPFTTNPSFYFEESTNLEQRALFAEVSYELLDNLTATLGGRYFKYEKDERNLTEGGSAGVLLGEGVPQVLSSAEGNSSYKASLSYKPQEETLLYVSWAEGFRLGRPAAGLPSATCDPNGDGLIDGSDVSIASTRRINSDFLENYELGAKFSALDRRLIVEAAIYHIEWDGLPIRTVADSCNLAYTANVGAATSDGAEFQTTFFATSALRFVLGGSYNDAQLSENAPDLFTPAFKGDRLPGAPQFNGNAAVQYDFTVAGRGAFVRADSFYTGKFFRDLGEGPPDTRAGDYIKVDARIGVNIDRLNVELFANNLTNRTDFTWHGYGGAAYRLRPRTIGVQLGYTFE